MLNKELQNEIIVAYNSKFLRAKSTREVKMLEEYYTEVSGKKEKVGNCGQCIYKLCIKIYPYLMKELEQIKAKEELELLEQKRLEEEALKVTKKELKEDIKADKDVATK